MRAVLIAVSKRAKSNLRCEGGIPLLGGTVSVGLEFDGMQATRGQSIP